MPISQAVINQLDITEENLASFMVTEMRNIFTDLIGVDNAFQALVLIEPINTFSNNITAVVGLAGTDCSGLLRLHLPESMALDVASKMLGSHLTTINDEALDAIGELANILAGSFEYHLTSHGNLFRLSPPSIFTGNEYFFTNKALDESIAILCDVRDEWFMVSLTLVAQ
jgi:CheY-specific phosphatase CheX